MTIGEKIKSIRRQKGVSQKHIQQVSGIQRNFLSLIENNKRGISYNTLERIAQALSVSVGYIADYEADSEYAPFQPEKSFQAAEAEPEEANQEITLSLVPVVSEQSLEFIGQQSPAPINWIQAPSLWLPKGSGNCCAVWISRTEQGLPPLIEAGSLVCLDLTQRDPQALQGKLAAFWTDGKCLIRRTVLPTFLKHRIIGRVCCYFGAPG